jgi:hypothetical protein
MPGIATTLEMIVKHPTDTEWMPPKESNPAQRPVEMDLPKLRKQISFPVLVSKSSRVHFVTSALLPGNVTTYYAHFSPSCVLHYFFENKDRMFTTVQRQILSSSHPMMFVYEDNVKTKQIGLNGGMATIVMPTFRTAHPFVVWVRDDIYVWSTFFWPVAEQDIIHVVDSFSV